MGMVGQLVSPVGWASAVRGPNAAQAEGPGPDPAGPLPAARGPGRAAHPGSRRPVMRTPESAVTLFGLDAVRPNDPIRPRIAHQVSMSPRQGVIAGDRRPDPVPVNPRGPP